MGKRHDKNSANEPVICMWEDELSGHMEACTKPGFRGGILCTAMIVEVGWSWGRSE